MIKVKSFKKLKGNSKKYEITFEKNGKTYVRKFGAAGMSDYTIHKDKERRERYISRHKKDLRTNDPMKPGYLSMYILWNKPSIKASLADYKRRLNVYNRTGKFPKGITGSKKLSFGAKYKKLLDDFSNKVGQDPARMILEPYIATGIQNSARARIYSLPSLRADLESIAMKEYKQKESYYKKRNRSVPKEAKLILTEYWRVLNPVLPETARWLTRASKILKITDIDPVKQNLWWKIIEETLKNMEFIERRGDPSEELPKDEYTNYEKSQTAIMTILNTCGYPITDDDIDEGWADEALSWWRIKSKDKTFKKSSFGTVKDMKNYSDIAKFLRDKTGKDPSIDFIEPQLKRNLKDYSASKISAVQRGKTTRSNLPTKKNLKNILWNLNAAYESPAYANEEMKSGTPWTVLNPGKKETAKWLYLAADTLTAKDFDDDELWYNSLEHILSEFIDIDPDRLNYASEVQRNLTVSTDNIEIIMKKLGYHLDFDAPRWYTRAHAWLTDEWATGNAFGKKYKVPDNVVNKSLYANVKSKIKRSIKGRRWGAYDSGRLVREYKAAGGKYKGTKGKTNLSRWYKEKWVDACAWPKSEPCGRKTKESIAYCRPSKKVDSKTPKLVQKLTAAQRKSRCARKKKTPMKRITKFGREIPTPDIHVGNGWMIHCTHVPGVGNHATLRLKDDAWYPRPGADHAFRYGIRYRGGRPEFWSSGSLARNLDPYYQNMLVYHYEQYCNSGRPHAPDAPYAKPYPTENLNYRLLYGNIKKKI